MKALPAVLYAALQFAIAGTRPSTSAGRWAAMGAMLGLAPWLCGRLGRRLGLSSRATVASVLVPACVLALLMLPFLSVESLSRQRNPGMGGALHVALTGVLILGGLLGTQAACVLRGWERGR